MTKGFDSASPKKRKIAGKKPILETSTPPNWSAFSDRLIGALQSLETGQWLNVQKPNSHSDWIQFDCQGRAGFRVEAKSNWYRSDDDQLTPEQIQGLLLLGWLLPTGSDLESNPVSDPHGSPNFFVQLPVKLSLKGVNALVARTFIDVLAIKEPDGLVYEAFESDGTTLCLADLGLEPVAGNTDQHPELAKAVLDVMKEITSIPDLVWDVEGDIGPLNYKSIRCYVRVVEDAKYIRFYAPLLMGVEATRGLLHKVNELNTVHGFMHLCLMPNLSLMAVSDVLSTGLVESHMAQALAHFMQIADEFAIELEAEFGSDVAPECHQFH